MKKALIGIIMGSQSDWSVMQDAAAVLKEFKVPFETAVVSAHRTPEKMFEYAQTAKDRGLQVIIAGAGGAAHLPGMVASLTPLPVLGVPIGTKKLKGLDSLLSIAQMPKGVPVATMAIDNAANAALLAVRILSLQDKKLSKSLAIYTQKMEKKVKAMNRQIRTRKY